MKKQLLALFSLCLVLCATSGAFAQFEKGDKLLNAGISGGGYGFYNSGFGVGASFEYGITDFISVGAQADFRFYSYRWLGIKDSYVAMPIALRGSYHFGKHFLTIDNLDLYGGPQLGFNIDNNEYYNDSDIVIGIHAGARYYFQPKLGVFAELSGGQNVFPLKAGITLKF